MSRSAHHNLPLVDGVAPSRIVAAALCSGTLAALSTLLGWHLWKIVLLALLPWIPVVLRQLAWIERRDRWLAALSLVALLQSGHQAEHAVEMVQRHLLGMSGACALGVFGALNIEWVHYLWQVALLGSLVALLRPLRANPWLWVSLPLNLWHTTEHHFLMYTYLTTGVAGTPGLVARGGALGGGLPIDRPELHFFYNLLETVPLAFAVSWQQRQPAVSLGQRAILTAPLPDR